MSHCARQACHKAAGRAACALVRQQKKGATPAGGAPFGVSWRTVWRLAAYAILAAHWPAANAMKPSMRLVAM